MRNAYAIPTALMIIALLSGCNSLKKTFGYEDGEDDKNSSQSLIYAEMYSGHTSTPFTVQKTASLPPVAVQAFYAVGGCIIGPGSEIDVVSAAIPLRTSPYVIVSISGNEITAEFRGTHLEGCWALRSIPAGWSASSLFE